MGKEKADELAKGAITSAEAVVVPLTRSSIKREFQGRVLIKWQKQWDDGGSGRTTNKVLQKVGLKNHYWPRQLTRYITEHGPFPVNLNRFGNHHDTCCACGEIGMSMHYATKCALTLSYHLKCGQEQHQIAWLKSIVKNRLLSKKIADLVNFIARNEDILKPEQLE
ncbi:hypothetical protein AVEN_208586-1 [Araneus ventricosus]|uniref:Uncharacterized protein n=1 Tax=Araneus ventricosus TaxID=182803 RepID=A0A4Y2CJV6_ARAVE|nr:hypothetical protein AVEN_239622-1 [Araneus ventricosus]GBM04382.1 hypothetical protein AVEN_242961-1 [Araneus ventricosus]GBM04387.1 hypothetical protein AVEN_253979-1 [Araneus ventricosus]GBM04399.1 hypothetical protein AVEN_260512-1 [Araneus ventricosus]GBM04440.1 hypothetical protein AVEN_72803-1 [Araneus ventricosus]